MAGVINFLTLFGAGLLALIYMTGIKGLIGILVLFLGMMLLVYFKQNNLLYMPCKNLTNVEVPGLPKSPSENQYKMRHPR